MIGTISDRPTLLSMAIGFLALLGVLAGLAGSSTTNGERFSDRRHKPGLKVSWQVTGIRHDPYAEQNRIVVEESKPADERRTYLYPQGYGQPESLGRDYQRNADLGQKETHGP